jgi:hypothetical protein
LTTLTDLTEFDVSSNALTGQFPAGAWSKLLQLSIYQNQLSGSFPRLTSTTGLKSLSIANNQFSGPVPDVRNMGSLGTLSIEHNQFTGSLPSYLVSASSLRTFYAYDNKLSGAVPYLPFTQYSACYLSYPDDDMSNSFTCPLPGNANTRCNIIGGGGSCRAYFNPNSAAPTPSPSFADHLKRLKFEISAVACGLFLIVAIAYVYRKNTQRSDNGLSGGELPASRVYNAEEKAHARAVLKEYYAEHDPSKGTDRNIR